MSIDSNITVIVSNDKIGQKFIQSIANHKINILIDKSSSFKRIFKLVKRKRVSVWLLLKMFFAEICRKKTKFSLDSFDSVKSNKDLLSYLQKNQSVDLIVLFRAGLIINKAILDSGIEILNLHCAKLPDYKGIGVIDKALQNQDIMQEATLHHVSLFIDEGKTIATEPYQLDLSLSYRSNEDIAYDAGIRLFQKSYQEFSWDLNGRSTRQISGMAINKSSSL